MHKSNMYCATHFEKMADSRQMKNRILRNNGNRCFTVFFTQ